MAKKKSASEQTPRYVPDYDRGKVIVVANEWRRTDIPRFVGEELGYRLVGETDDFPMYDESYQGFVYETKIGEEKRAIRRFMRKKGVELAYIFDRREGRRTSRINEIVQLSKKAYSMDLFGHGKKAEKEYQDTLDELCKKAKEAKRI